MTRKISIKQYAGVGHKVRISVKRNVETYLILYAMSLKSESAIINIIFLNPGFQAKILIASFGGNDWVNS